MKSAPRMPESGRGERIALEHIGVLRGKQKTRQAVVKIDPSHPQSTSEKDRVESQVTSPDVEVRPLPTIHLIQNSMGDQCDLIHKVDDSGAGGTKPIDHHVKIMSEDHCCDLKSKYKKKHSSGAILQLNEHQQATDFIQTSKSLSSSRKVLSSYPLFINLFTFVIIFDSKRSWCQAMPSGKLPRQMASTVARYSSPKKLGHLQCLHSLHSTSKE